MPKRKTEQPSVASEVPVATGQPDAEQMQAAQQLRRQHVVLKASFADVSVALTIAQEENRQLIQQLRLSQRTIEALRGALEAANASATDKKTAKVKE